MSDIYIFDNFYTDPYKVREFALNCEYTLSAPSNWKYNNDKVLWPGLVTNSIYREKNIDVRVSKLLGKPVRSDATSGFFRLSKQGDTTDYFVHTDGLPVENKTNYSGIVYLSLPEHCEGKKGTIFYKHKSSGKIKLETVSDYNLTLNDLKHTDSWEIHNIIEIKFNRLVLLNQPLFHAIGDVFGDTNENSRIAQIFRFYEI